MQTYGFAEKGALSGRRYCIQLQRPFTQRPGRVEIRGNHVDLGVEQTTMRRFEIQIAAIMGASTKMAIQPPSEEAQNRFVEHRRQVPADYSNFADVFYSDPVAELSEHSGINDHPIDLDR